ncbi:MAG: beta-L-arabinofuranosidase domain-containing protein, partial [Vicinamibacteria bacterium]
MRGQLSVFLSIGLLLEAVAAGAAPASPAAATFPLRNVRILEGPFHDAQERDRAYLLSLDPDRLLHTFRRNAGLATSARPYGGWEAPDVELRGHSLGHYLTACALMYEATGDERLEERALAIAAQLRTVQQALPPRGMNPGYLSAFPEELFDRLEALKAVWAPYYT